MITITSVGEMSAFRRKHLDRTIGFVPTMGYLHEGHLSLVRASLAENDLTVASIFLNPAQFAPHEDFDRYPREPERDRKMLESLGVDLLFLPNREEIYPDNYRTYVTVEQLELPLCGRSRPHFFRGVATVVLKLFNIVKPDRTYFGQKDAQQLAIIRRLVSDLNLPLKVVGLPIVRDRDGLALSSRNRYLNSEERAAAQRLPGTLNEAREKIQSGLRTAADVIDLIRNSLSEEPLIRIDYVQVVDLENLQNIHEITNDPVLVACAVWVGKTRLIDNFILGENTC